MFLNIEETSKKEDQLFVKNATESELSRKSLVRDLSNRRKRLYSCSIFLIVLAFVIFIFEKFTGYPNYYACNLSLIGGFFSLTHALIMDSKVKALSVIDELIEMKKI